MRSSQIPEDCERKFTTERDRLHREAANLQGLLRELGDEVERYKGAHGLQRGPQLKAQEDRNRALALLGAFSVLQLLSNALLFGAGSAFGLAFGLFVAVVLAAFDIGLHFILGRWAARVTAPDAWNRVFGAVAGLTAAGTVLALNVGAVHLRRVSQVAVDGGPADWNQWLPGLLNDPFGFTDFLSWLLFGVGILCSLLAIGSGWLWDEPIPLLRKNGRLMARHSEDLEDVEEHRRRLVSSLIETYEQKLNALDRQAETHVAIMKDSVGRIRQLCADFESYCVGARETYVALVSRYRDQNRIHRDGRAVPEYFQRAPNIDMDASLAISLADLDELESNERHSYDHLKDTLQASRVRLRRLDRGEGTTVDAGAGDENRATT